MRVLILSTCIGKGFGAEMVLRHLIRGWKSRDILLQVAAPPESGVLHTAVEAGLHHTQLEIHSNRLHEHLKATWQLRMRLDRNGFDLVHAWSAREFELALMLAAGRKTTGTLHDHPKADFHSFVRKRLMRTSANRFHALACVSSAVVEACSAAKYRCPLHVVRNGLTDLHSQSKSRPGDRRLRIGFLGMYADWKGFDCIHSWISDLKQAPVQWKLYGDPTPRNRELCSALPENVSLEGWKPTESIWPEIDVLVHASTGFDPLPTVLIEASRAGIPCVASSRGGAGEIVENGCTGFLFSPDDSSKGLDALKRLIDEPDLVKRVGSNARKRFETVFTIQHMTDAYEAFWSNPLDV